MSRALNTIRKPKLSTIFSTTQVLSSIEIISINMLLRRSHPADRRLNVLTVSKSTQTQTSLCLLCSSDAKVGEPPKLKKIIHSGCPMNYEKRID